MASSARASIIAIVPARAGSKGLPGKNTRPLAGRPLVEHTIVAALESGVFARVLVTSDDPEVLQIAGCHDVVPIVRPKELTADDTPMAPVVEHLLALEEAGTAETFALLQPTSPLRQARHIQECAALLQSGAYSSAVGVCQLEHPPQKALTIEEGHLSPLFSWEALNQNRQDITPAYRQNGSMWFLKREAFLETKRFVVSPAVAYVMGEGDSIDIDTEEDFARAEKILAQRLEKNSPEAEVRSPQ